MPFNKREKKLTVLQERPERRSHVDLADIGINSHRDIDDKLRRLEKDGTFFVGKSINEAAVSGITDDDKLGFWESVANDLRSITWANIKATLKIYFDGLYVALTGDQTIAGVKTFSSDPIIPDEPYDATAWDGSMEPPTKNALRDKIEGMVSTPGGSDTQIQFNDGGAFGGDADLTWDKTNNVLNIGGTPPAAATSSLNQDASGVSVGHFLWTHGATFASYLTGVFSRGTKASPTQSLLGDIALKLRGRWHDDSTYGNTQAEVRFTATQDHTTTAHGTKVGIYTTPNDSTTLTTAPFEVHHNGGISSVPYTDTKEPTGWANPANIAVSYDSTTQKITLTAVSGTLDYYWRGVKTSLASPWVSSAHTNTVGHQYYLSSTDGTTFAWATDTVWTFDAVMVAMVNYQTSYKHAHNECHGLMQWQVHEELHQVVGTFKESGGTLDPASYTLLSTTAAQRRPDVVVTHLHDEDIDLTLAALTSKAYNKFYLSGAAVNNYTGETADIVPLLTDNPYYNLFSTPNWTQVLMANNSYMCVWLVGMLVTSDAGSQAYRYIWIQGQHNGNLASQVALTSADLNLGTLASELPEFCFLVKVIIRYTGGNWDLYSITNLSGSKFSQVGSPAGAFLSSVTTNGSLTGDGSTGNPLSASSGATTATAAGTTTLTVASMTMQEFTGATTQTVVLPVVTTLRLGHRFIIVNNSTGTVTVNSSGGNAVASVTAGVSATIYCILITGTTAASWHVVYNLSSADNTEAVAFLNGGTGTHTAMDAHIASTANPHSTTAAQVRDHINTTIEGINLLYNSAASLDVGTGYCYAENGDFINITAAITKSGLSLTAATWYHVYVYLSGGAAAAEVVTTAPVLWKGTAYTKTGDTTRRYVGSVKPSGTNVLFRFLHSGNKMAYNTNTGAAAPPRILSAGAATVATDIDASTIVPVTSRIGLIRWTNLGTSAVDIGNTDVTTILTLGNAASGYNHLATDWILTTTQKANYKNAAAGGALYVDVLGYTFER
jgi:hypothetical protein